MAVKPASGFPKDDHHGRLDEKGEIPRQLALYPLVLEIVRSLRNSTEVSYSTYILCLGS